MTTIYVVVVLLLIELVVLITDDVVLYIFGFNGIGLSNFIDIFVDIFVNIDYKFQLCGDVLHLFYPPSS